MKIKIKKINPEAKLPTYARAGDACMDVFALEDIKLRENRPHKIGTGLAFEVPPGWELQVRGRSGLAKDGVLCHLGTLDSGYRGEMAVVLVNTRPMWHEGIKKGMAIAQICIQKVTPITWDEVDELEPSERGVAGFGSSDPK